MAAAPPLPPCLRSVRAVVFDTDGVITDSAGSHAAAWKKAFDAVLSGVEGQRPFDAVDDYLRHVDGRSRRDGAVAFLASRGLDLPEGDPGDPPGTGTVWAVAARKDELFTRSLRTGHVDVWPGTVRLLDALRERRTPCAAVSASRHATELLSRAGVAGRFAAVVDGNEAGRLGLPGKPDPALFVEAARRLGVPVRDTAVVEDALAGVEAGRRGGFGLVIGVDRTGGPDSAAALRRHGADLVVSDPGDLLTGGTTAGDEAGAATAAVAGIPAWTWSYEGYDPRKERLREALCTLGNGYFATRGAAPETTEGPAHYPGTYAAGCYDRLASSVEGRTVENEDLVNLPNWLPLRYRVRPEGAAPGPWLTPDHAQLVEHAQWLDLKGGTLTRRSVYKDGAGRRLRVEQCRLVHMGDRHLAALRTVFRAEGWTGVIEVESGIDGDVRNSGVERYQGLANRHLTGWATGTDHDGVVSLRCRTVESDIGIALAARTRAGHEAGPTGAVRPEEPVGHGEPAAYDFRQTPTSVFRRLALPLGPGRDAVVDKTVALCTSRDRAIGSPLRAASAEVRRAPGFPDLLASHRRAWAELWRQVRLEVAGQAGRVLRLHLFHVLQTLSPHTAELDVGVPARGLHGEAYRGHVFWDELFVLRFLNLHLPEVSRGLLDYRHRRLPAACRAADEAGRAGAMYPWQSADTGREETQEIHLNPRSGHWLPDHSRLQHHVGSAVAYNVWQYCQATGDTDYLHSKGAEMLLQIARFWASGATWDDSLGRYRIRGVVGPDEYHDAYPGARTPGLDDNAYTNVTAAWVLSRALELYRELPEGRRRRLLDRFGLDADETERWEDVSRRLHVPYHRGVISQFAGYGELAELDWEGYRRRYGDIRRLDRILEAEGDSVNRYQASKQADVLMLGYLFSPRELAGLFRRLGHPLDDDGWRATVDHYLARTSHGSTLSSLVHAWVLARVRRDEAWAYCEEALIGDVADTQGGTTEEGVHLGAMAGTLDFVQRGMTGLETREDALWLDPAELPQLSKFGVRIRFRQHWDVDLRFRVGRVRIAVPGSHHPAVRVVLGGHTHVIAPGTARWLHLPPGPPSPSLRATPGSTPDVPRHAAGG